MKTRIQQGFTLIELLVVITIIAILAGLALPTFTKIQEKGNMTKGISNARQIITALRIYASDNNGNYSDADASAPTTANLAYRVLFVNSILDGEGIFGCPAAKDGNPDGDTGGGPAFLKACEENTKENHWAMTFGISDSAGGGYPLVYENPKSGAFTGSGPSWDADAAGTGAIGRTWSGGKVIIGLNDSSVITEKTAPTGTGPLLPKTAGGKNIFENVNAAAPATVVTQVGT